MGTTIQVGNDKRARAIGILMDDYGEFSDVDEVHIILGPKNDIKLQDQRH